MPRWNYQRANSIVLPFELYAIAFAVYFQSSAAATVWLLFVAFVSCLPAGPAPSSRSFVQRHPLAVNIFRGLLLASRCRCHVQLGENKGTIRRSLQKVVNAQHRLPRAGKPRLGWKKSSMNAKESCSRCRSANSPNTGAIPHLGIISVFPAGVLSRRHSQQCRRRACPIR